MSVLTSPPILRQALFSLDTAGQLAVGFRGSASRPLAGSALRLLMLVPHPLSFTWVFRNELQLSGLWDECFFTLSHLPSTN